MTVWLAVAALVVLVFAAQWYAMRNRDGHR
jgi:hypothetical protein